MSKQSRSQALRILAALTIGVLFGLGLLWVSGCLAPATPGIPLDKLPGLLGVPKVELIEKLKAIESIDDPSAEIVLWRLGFDHKLTQGDILHTTRFLESARSDTFSAAVECAQQSDEPAVIKKLRSFADSDDLWKLKRVAGVLHHKGDDGPLDRLTSVLKDQGTPPEQRRNLTSGLLGVDPRHLAPLFIELLSDANVWVRYNAICQLRELAETEHGYDYEGKGDNSVPIKEWREWYRKNRRSLPTESKRDWERQMGGIGAEIKIEDEGIRVIRVLQGFAAEKAGMKTGDIITETNGHPVQGKTLAELVAYELRRQEGTKLTLTFKRPQTGESRTVTLTREIITVAK